MTTNTNPSAVPDVPTTPAILAKDFSEYYDVQEDHQLGTGAFSKVVTGTQKQSPHHKRAIKIMAMTAMNDRKVLSMLAHEKEILRRTQHPNILQLYECVTTPDRVYMVMELMKGDLFEFTVGRRRRLNEIQAAQVMKQLFSAVAYLHNINVVHRDIKLENILVNEWNDIRLADFGLAKIIRDTNQNVKNTPCGTGFYIAPEVISAIDSGYGGITALITSHEKLKLLDLWSCGVVLYVLLSGRPPFAGQVKTATERRDLLAKIDRGVLFPDAHWNHVSTEAKDLIQRLLNRDSNQRITADTAGTHDWFIAQEEKLKEYYARKEAEKKAAAAEAAAQAEAAEAEAEAQQRKQQEEQLTRNEAVQEEEKINKEESNGPEEEAASPLTPANPTTTEGEEGVAVVPVDPKKEAEEVRNEMDALQHDLQEEAEVVAGAEGGGGGGNEGRSDVKVVTASAPSGAKMTSGPPARRGGKK